MKLKQRETQRKHRHALNVQGRKTNADKRRKQAVAKELEIQQANRAKIVEHLEIEPPYKPEPAPIFKKTPPIQKLRSYLKEKFGF